MANENEEVKGNDSKENDNGNNSNDNSSSNNGNDAGRMNSIKVKLPTFWQTSPETWFIQAEAEFALSRITSEASKYNYVVRALPQEVADSITDLLKQRPTVDAYKQIKEKLIERHSLSIETRIRKLISDEMIGDKKPSEFYRKLLHLAGDFGTVGEELVKKLWLNRLPNVISIALIPQSGADIQTLMKVADQIYEAVQSSNLSALNFTSNQSSFQSKSQANFQTNLQSNPQANFQPNIQSNSQANIQPNVPQCCGNCSSNANPFSIESLQAEISELKKAIGRFQGRQDGGDGRSRSRFRNRSPAQFRERSKSRRSYNPAGPLCYYHFRFGNRARDCKEPCSFVNRNSQPNSQSNSGN